MESKVKLRYFDDWAGDGPSIFFSADLSSVRKLEDLFCKLAFGDIEEVELNSLDFIQPFFNVNIIASAGIQDLGIKKKKDRFLWAVTASEWEKYGNYVSVFKESNSGHQYLDTGSDYFYPFQIIVSVKRISRRLGRLAETIKYLSFRPIWVSAAKNPMYDALCREGTETLPYSIINVEIGFHTVLAYACKTLYSSASSTVHSASLLFLA